MPTRPIRILHTADLHLCLRPARDGGLARALEGWRTILGLCRKYRIDILLIAGDLFDQPDSPEELARAVLDLAQDQPALKIAVSPGNHDPNTIDSLWQSWDFPPNWHIFTGDWRPWVLPELDTVVWGVAFTAAYQDQSLLGKVDQELLRQAGAGSLTGTLGLSGRPLQLGLMHGNLGNLGSDRMNPLTEADIAASGLDYLALGHHHQGDAEIGQAGATRYCYPGSAEGHNFYETGPRSCLVGTVFPGDIRLRRVALPGDRYEITDLTLLRENRDTAVLAAWIEEELNRRYGEPAGRIHHRVVLRGETRHVPETAQLTRMLWKRLSTAMEEGSAPEPEVWDRTTRLFRGADYAGDTSLRGDYVRVTVRSLRKARNAGDEKHADSLERTLRTGLEAFNDPEHLLLDEPGQSQMEWPESFDLVRRLVPRTPEHADED